MLTVLTLILCLGIERSFAQNVEKEREFVVLELIIKRELFSHKIKVPISETPFSKDGKAFIDGEFTAGGWATTHCTNCPLTSEYEIFAYAIPTSSDSAKVSLWVSFVNKLGCNIKEKTFLIKKGTNVEVKSKCGVKIIAYYDFEEDKIKTTNNRQITTNKNDVSRTFPNR